ncbi:MAG TPA: hypothetical protein VJZ49_11080 [Syntrophales bacterium]|nr:hypothetical protein [Syntrophales bacterium]
MNQWDQKSNRTHRSKARKNPHDISHGDSYEAVSEVFDCQGNGETIGEVLKGVEKHNCSTSTDEVQSLNDFPGQATRQWNPQKIEKNDMKNDGEGNTIRKGGQPFEFEDIAQRQDSEERG